MRLQLLIQKQHLWVTGVIQVIHYALEQIHTSVIVSTCNSASPFVLHQTAPTMILQKTAKAQEELQPGTRQLPQRARSLLLMAGGKSMEELQALLGSDHAALAQQLVAQGYLELIATGENKSSSPALAPAINMAGTRMYLFDLCERLFANRHETLAQTLRTQLREARDLSSLRSASLSFLEAVQEYAGEERAQSLRERLAALLACHEESGEAVNEVQKSAATEASLA